MTVLQRCRHPISVKGVLIHDGRVLLLLNERGEWDLPGGRPDPGEDHRAALEREVREETGLEVEVGAPLDEHLFEVLPGRFVRILPFACRLVGRERRRAEPRASRDALAAARRARRDASPATRCRRAISARSARLIDQPRSPSDAGGLNRQEPVVRRGGAEPQLVPGIEGLQRIGERELAHGAPAGLASRRRRRRAPSSRSPRPAACRMADSQRAKSRALCRSPRSTSVGRSMSRAVSSWNCRPTRRATRPSSVCASVGAQQLLQGRQHGAQIFERRRRGRCAEPALLRPVRGLELGLVGPVDARHLLRAVGEAHALVFLRAAGRSRSSSLRGPACRRPSCRCRRSPGPALPSDTPLWPCQPCSMAADTECGTAAIAVPRQIQRGGG